MDPVKPWQPSSHEKVLHSTHVLDLSTAPWAQRPIGGRITKKYPKYLPFFS